MRKELEHKYEALFESYHFEKPLEGSNINFIIKKSLQSFLKGCKNAAIYCNGGHTRMLMSDFMFELKSVKYIVDNYSQLSSDGGFRLIRDEELEDNEIDAVVISSFKFKDVIVEELKRKHPQIKYLNIYDKLAENGIHLQSNYYYHNHPYHYYKTINTIQRQIERTEGKEELKVLYFQLITQYVHIKDFRMAGIYAGRLLQISSTEKNRSLVRDIEELYNDEIKAVGEIGDKNVLMLCIDGLRREDLDDQFMPKMKNELQNNGFVFRNAYSFSTSTFESLIPVYGEQNDLRTEYYKNNSVLEDGCRLIREAKRQKRNIYFYTDMERYVEDQEIRYSSAFQTVTEKLWNFVLNAVEEKNGLFYIHILYESHFSFANPYTVDKLISEGAVLLYDFLPQRGGKLRTNYVRQHKDALRYLDDVLFPFLNRMKCRMLMYADHGNLILDETCGIEDISEQMLTCAETCIRIPYVVKSPEMGRGESKELISLMSLNDIVISLLKQKKYEMSANSFIKIARSQLYNPNYCSLCSMIKKEQSLLAFEAFIFTAGYKLVIYADGKVELYRTETDEKMDSHTVMERLIAEIKDCVTVCNAENIKL